MIIVLLGPPGAGKGTQGERIAQRLGIPKIATGDVLREAIRNGTEQGLAAKKYMDSGELVPDSVILSIMKDALSTPATAKGAILDGVVRTVPQAEGLAKLADELGRKIDKVVLFDVPLKHGRRATHVGHEVHSLFRVLSALWEDEHVSAVGLAGSVGVVEHVLAARVVGGDRRKREPPFLLERP